MITVLIIGKQAFFPLARFWGSHILFISGIKLQIKGYENINSDESYIFCANHSSLIDIPILLSSLSNNFRIIYKKELEKIPVFGWGLALSPFIGIKRENARDSMSGINEAVNTVSTGESVLIFPEGTRTSDGSLGEFKRGAFMLASRSGRKIVPVSIVGSAALLPNKEILLRSGTAVVNIGQAIEYTGSGKKDELDLMNKVRNSIKQEIERHI
jgi:1-acyl-sn-glycerol-3-phosphate acyltransferase